MSGNKIFVVDWEKLKHCGSTIVPNAKKVEVDREEIRRRRMYLR